MLLEKPNDAQLRRIEPMTLIVYKLKDETDYEMAVVLINNVKNGYFTVIDMFFETNNKKVLGNFFDIKYKDVFIIDRDVYMKLATSMTPRRFKKEL